jgi:hypothetical protein
MALNVIAEDAFLIAHMLAMMLEDAGHHVRRRPTVSRHLAPSRKTASRDH